MRNSKSSIAGKTGCLLGIICAAATIVAGVIVSRRLRSLPLAKSRVELLGIPIDPLTMQDALKQMETFIQSGAPHHIFTADASGIMIAQQDPDLKSIVRDADLITPDGAGVLLAGNLRGFRLPERVSGCDIVYRLSELAAQKGYRVFFFGAAEGVAQAAAEALNTRYPGLTIAGARNGYFSPEDEAYIAREIAAAKPDILFAALGIPKQEQFIRRNFHSLGIPVMIGIGGSFDVIAGKLKRAPRWMQRGGLEWLFRLIQEPKRLPRLMSLPRFIVAVWKSTRKA